jgi:hypothetical protein
MLGNLNPECPHKDHWGASGMQEAQKWLSSFVAEVAVMTLCVEYRCTPSGTGAWEKMLAQSASAVWQ